MKQLLDANRGGITPQGQVMWGYTQVMPGKHSSHETLAFTSLVRFISLVVELARRHDGADAWIEHQDRQAPMDTERDNTSRPDSYIHLVLAVAEKLGWHHLLMLAEFKKTGFNYSGGNHVLRNDPRRRFTFGLTAEDDEARIWFFSRACIVVKPRPQPSNPLPHSPPEPFHSPPLRHHIPGSSPLTELSDEDFMPVPDETPQTLGAHGTLSHLGFDPSIERYEVGGQVKYRIQVEQDTYILKHVLCDYKADELVGRATRVWSVYKEGHAEREFVLKDVWLEGGAPHEGDILRQLEAKCGASPDATLVDQFHTHFLLPNQALLKASGSSRPCAIGNTVILPSAAAPPRRFVGRQHYRILFPGVLMPLHLLRDVHQQAQVIADLPLALQVLLAVGFVHRDLSNTNAMFNPESQRGVLTDLEYAVEYGQPGQGDVKTHPSRPGVDLWISLWTVLFFVPTAECPEGEGIKPDRFTLFQSAFPAEERAGTRTIFLNADLVRKKAARNCISMDRNLRKHIVEYLFDKLPKLISRAHREAQQSLTAPGKTIPIKHPAFSKALHLARKVLEDYRAGLVKVLPPGAMEVRTIDAVRQDVLIITSGPDDPTLQKPSQDREGSGNVEVTEDAGNSTVSEEEGVAEEDEPKSKRQRM
ncbi:hypothetical protein C8F01DRAFT_1352409 [Mycena amicta]|nr:hypothetical protein C8F01DRAFT_1352409 [Mycena amicta]